MEPEVVVEGYVACECGTFMPDAPDRPAKALCPDCRATLMGRVQDAQVAFEVEGHRVLTSARKPKQRPKVTHHLSIDGKEFRRRSDRARMRAFVRLAKVYAPMFELLWEEEKLREGLPPVVNSRTPRTAETAKMVAEDLADAEERMGRPRQVDGP